MTLVLDNSVALAWSFQDERTPAVMELLARVESNGALAPAIWPLEALNGLLMAERRGRIDAAMRATLIAGLRGLPVALDSETTEQAWDITARIAAQHRLSVYDATYLELALRRRLPLASLDRALRRAATNEGLTVLGMDA